MTGHWSGYANFRKTEAKFQVLHTKIYAHVRGLCFVETLASLECHLLRIRSLPIHRRTVWLWQPLTVRTPWELWTTTSWWSTKKAIIFLCMLVTPLVQSYRQRNGSNYAPYKSICTLDFRSVAAKCVIIYSYTYIFLSVKAVLKLFRLQVEWTSSLQFTKLQAVILLQQSSRAPTLTNVHLRWCVKWVRKLFCQCPANLKLFELWIDS